MCAARASARQQFSPPQLFFKNITSDTPQSHIAISHPHKRGVSYELMVKSNSKGAYVLEDALSAMLIRSYRNGEMAKEEGFYQVLKGLNEAPSKQQQQYGAWGLPPSVKGADGDAAMRDG